MTSVRIVRHRPDRCTGCRECERACSKVQFRSEDGGDRSAIRILGDAAPYLMTVCDQRGLCIDLCPIGALQRRPNGVVWLDVDVCIGCQACVGFCPIGGMRRWEGRLQPFKCIACGSCIRACPEDALYFEEMPVDEVMEVVHPGLDA